MVLVQLCLHVSELQNISSCSSVDLSLCLDSIEVVGAVQCAPCGYFCFLLTGYYLVRFTAGEHGKMRLIWIGMIH